MNRIATVLFTAALLTGSAFAQDAKDDLFAGTKIFEKNATSVTEINQGPEKLSSVTGQHSSRAHSMMLNIVMTYEYDQPGMYNMADVDKFREKVNTGDWHCSVHERNLKSGESTDVCEKARSDGFKETAIISVEKKELTFIHQVQKEGDGGHSDASFMIFPGGANLDAVMAVSSAKMAAAQATMQAEIQVGLAQGLRGLSPMMYRDEADGYRTHTFVVKPDIHVAPEVHVFTRTPEAPEAPAPAEAAPAPAPLPPAAPIQ